MSLTTLQSFAKRLNGVVQGQLLVSDAAPSPQEVFNLLSEIQALLDSEPTPTVIGVRPSLESVSYDLMLKLMANTPHGSMEEYERIALSARKMAETLFKG
jgi:hypothetical protein